MKYVFLFLLLNIQVVQGMDIPCEDTLEEYISSTDIIFAGEIENSDLDSKGIGEVQFKILRQWKGEPLTHIDIKAGPRFPFHFSESGFYLVYVNKFKHEEKEFWSIPWCKQIRDLAYTGDEIVLLGEPKYRND